MHALLFKPVCDAHEVVVFLLHGQVEIFFLYHFYVEETELVEHR